MRKVKIPETATQGTSMQGQLVLHSSKPGGVPLLEVKPHVEVHLPEDATNDAKGTFFEDLVANLLRPMRFRIAQKLRVTGMEIDVLAVGLEVSQRVLVECKAQRDPLSADVISKLIGNTAIRKADRAFLFSTSELSKDGRGQWDEIEQDESLSKRFTWFPPDKVIDILASQSKIIAPDAVKATVAGAGLVLGGLTLLLRPLQPIWLIEGLRDGSPAVFSAINAANGTTLAVHEIEALRNAIPRLSSLDVVELSAATRIDSNTQVERRAPVARVVSGDSWEDLRPSRPVDFVGRDHLIRDIIRFIDGVRAGESATRTFAVQGPSGWGKSSLALKLANDVRKHAGLSFTAVDSRSATNSSFVAEALKLALQDASKRPDMGLSNGPITIGSIAYPLDSLAKPLQAVRNAGGLIVLFFDQFEELFAKEALFETFGAIRQLSLELDALQLPLVLGFAWKTDISLPQQHPAYHLWHQLSDRRRTFSIERFVGGEVVKTINKGERAFGLTFEPALKMRLAEQCQGFPWLLKKLLVHVLRRLREHDSQYALLERELDVEVLFKEDLATLNEEQLRCLKFVAHNAPVPVSDVEISFSKEAINLLTTTRLVIRSGMNYVVYWDIFRDYLTENRVPQIPWARCFQRDPGPAYRAIVSLSSGAQMTVPALARELGFREGPCANVVSDLVSFQLFERLDGDSYRFSHHIRDSEAETIAEHARRQLERHIVFRELSGELARGERMTTEQWNTLFKRVQPSTGAWSDKTFDFYGANLRRWLLFAGLIEQDGVFIKRPEAIGRDVGVIEGRRRSAATFLGTSSPSGIIRLLKTLDGAASKGVPREALDSQGLRNAVTDALVLSLVRRLGNGNVVTSIANGLSEAAIEDILYETVMRQSTVKQIAAAEGSVVKLEEIGAKLGIFLGKRWQPISARRYVSGLRSFLCWAEEVSARKVVA